MLNLCLLVEADHGGDDLQASSGIVNEPAGAVNQFLARSVAKPNGLIDMDEESHAGKSKEGTDQDDPEQRPDAFPVTPCLWDFLQPKESDGV